MLKRGGTRLSVIHRHLIWVECACGHTAPVWVADIIAEWGDDITVGETGDQMRCSSCRLKQIQEYRITYPGGSMEAMRGAEQGSK